MTRPTILGVLAIAAGTSLGCSVDNRVLRVADAQVSSDGDAPIFDAHHVGPDGSVACRPPLTPTILGEPASPASLAGVFAFAAPGLTPPTVTPVGVGGSVPNAFQVAANPGVTSDPSSAWGGVGFVFVNPTCVDARAYTGIKFTLTGDLGTCTVTFGSTSAADSPGGPGSLGTCTASTCMSPGMGPLPAGTTVMRFADLANGQPMPGLDTAELLAVIWGVSVPADPGITPCQATFTISDVAFVSD